MLLNEERKGGVVEKEKMTWDFQIGLVVFAQIFRYVMVARFRIDTGV